MNMSNIKVTAMNARQNLPQTHKFNTNYLFQLKHILDVAHLL